MLFPDLLAMRTYKFRRIVVVFLCVICLVFAWHSFSPTRSQWVQLDTSTPSIGHSDIYEEFKEKLQDSLLETHPKSESHRFRKRSSPILEEEMLTLKRDDLAFEDKMDRIDQMRRNRLKESCRQMNLTQPMPASVKDLHYQPVLVVSDVHKAIFCFTGDIYSEMWREILGYEDIRSIYTYRPESIVYRTKYYYKFLVVQDPLLRLMDAYHFGLSSADHSVFDEKGQEISEELMKLSQEIRSNYRAHGKYSKGIAEKQTYALFQDFAMYIMQKSYLNEKLHYLWERVHVMCSPCSIEYDYISRAETVFDDLRYIVKKFKTLPQDELIPNTIDSDTAESLLSRFQNQFGSELLKKLSKVYENDYNLFGYKPFDT